jgi:hypothetical protein
MTLKMMQGFETMRDDSDLRAQGWVASPTLQPMAFAGSLSSLNGVSLRSIGAGASNTGAPGASGVPDPGFFNTGITVNQAWQAGGFVWGFNAKLNGAVANSYGTSSSNNQNQVCFDGSLYWAVQKTGGATYNVATSPDLKTWTTTTAQPAGGTGQGASIFYMGGGVVGVISGAYNSTTGNLVYYTSNNGASWSTSVQMGTYSSGSAPVEGIGFATGNSTYPHGIAFGTGAVMSNGTYGGIWIGNLATGMVQVANFTSLGFYVTGRPFIQNGIIVINSQGTQQFSATASNSALNTAGAWTASTFAAIGNKGSLAYSPTANIYVIATSAGLYTFPNTGGTNTPVIQSGTITTTQRSSVAAMYGVYWTGTQFVAHGASGYILTSPDGVTWTNTSHVLPLAGAFSWTTSLYDGSKYVLFSDANSGVIATTPDMVSNYAVQYVMEGAEGNALVNGNGHTGVYSGTAPSPTTGLWTPTANFFGFALGALSSGNRQMNIINAGSGTEATRTLNGVQANPIHYFELVCKAAAGANAFTHEIWVDGQPLYQGATGIVMGSGSSDTTSFLILCLDRFFTITGYDDSYFNLIDGQGLSGVLGIVNIVAQRGETDTQAQWVKTGGAASNSLSVNQPALSSSSANYVSSSNAGDKDIYATTDTLPAGYTPKAIQNEAYFTKTSTTAPVVNIGSLSGSTESDSANATISGTGAYVSQILEKDPNGNVALTSGAVNAMKFVLNHIS